MNNQNTNLFGRVDNSLNDATFHTLGWRTDEEGLDVLIGDGWLNEKDLLENGMNPKKVKVLMNKVDTYMKCKEQIKEILELDKWDEEKAENLL